MPVMCIAGQPSLLSEGTIRSLKRHKRSCIGMVRKPHQDNHVALAMDAFDFRYASCANWYALAECITPNERQYTRTQKRNEAELRRITELIHPPARGRNTAPNLLCAESFSYRPHLHLRNAAVFCGPLRCVAGFS